MSQYEHQEQAKFFRMINYLKKEDGVTVIDESFLTFAVPNAGKRSPAMASYMKAEGLKSGVPDVMLPIARDRFLGLAIEMKYGDNTQSPAQKIWQLKLEMQNWNYQICYTAESAFYTWAMYLHLPEEDIHLIERAFLFQEVIL
jgi:hypothetical protein